MIRRLPSHARLLEEPVRLPGGDYPDSYTTHPDPTDELLAEWHDGLWPDEEWIDVEACPRLDLFPYETFAAACDALRRDRAHAGLLRHAFCRVRACRCGAFHVGPWVLRPRLAQSADPFMRGAAAVLLALTATVVVLVGALWLSSPVATRSPAAVVRTGTPATPFVTVAPAATP